MSFDSPWNIIGWAVIVILCCLGLVTGFTIIGAFLWGRFRWISTHDTAPEPGQVWNQRGARLYVISVTLNDVTLRSYEYKEPTEWTESLGAWKNRVKIAHLYLMPKETARIKARMKEGTFG